MMPVLEIVTRSVYRAPTSGRTRATRAAAYREEAKARFAASCDCREHGSPCRYHDRDRWERDIWGYSRNGRIIARWAAMLARRDGFFLPHPPPPERIHAAADDDGDLPF